MWTWVKSAWTWMTTANFNTILAIVGIGFALVGWNQSTKADQTLKEIKNATKKLESDIDKIQETEQNMEIALEEVRNAETRLESSIINLEDATRRNLQGFAEIFARALWLLEKSEEEIWYVNFLFGFGRPHRYNRKILEEYTPLANTLKITQTNFQDAVAEFSEVLDSIHKSD